MGVSIVKQAPPREMFHVVTEAVRQRESALIRVSPSYGAGTMLRQILDDIHVEPRWFIPVKGRICAAEFLALRAKCIVVDSLPPDNHDLLNAVMLRMGQAKDESLIVLAYDDIPAKYGVLFQYRVAVPISMSMSTSVSLYAHRR